MKIYTKISAAFGEEEIGGSIDLNNCEMRDDRFDYKNEIIFYKADFKNKNMTYRDRISNTYLL